MADGGSTLWDPMVDTLLSMRINRALGGPFFSPLDVGDLTDELADVILALGEGLPKMRDGILKVEETKARLRAEHKKRHKR